MNLKTLSARLTSLEDRQRRALPDDKPEWYDHMPDDLKADVEIMKRTVEEAGGGISDDPFVMKTKNAVLKFMVAWDRQRVVKS